VLARRAELAAVLAFLVPAAVLSSGLIFTWNHRSTSAIYGGLSILVLALVGRYAVLGVRAVVAGFGQVPAHYEEAAAVFGASYTRRLARVLVPLRGRFLATLWLLSFIACLRDLDTVVSCHPPGLDPLPVRIFTLEANAPVRLVAGLASCQVLLTLLVLTLAGVLSGVKRGARS
jgi:iron(III) transport system permease protein